MAKEYIDRAALIENLNKFAPGEYSRAVDLIIEKQPAADVVEVVRCRDCFYNANGCCTKSEQYDDTRYRPDYFCADGYRRDDNAAD